MIKIYIGIENGVIDFVQCDHTAELCIISLDKDSFPNTLVREENLIATSCEDMASCIKQAKAEEKQSRKEWNDYEITGE